MADTHFKSGETVYNRFTREALTVVSCDGCVAMVRDHFGSVGGSIVGDITRETPLEPYGSSTAQKFAPGNFVTTWNPELGRDAVGVTRAIKDVQEANPLILVKWMHDLSEEWIRSEYLYREVEPRTAAGSLD